MLRYFTMRKTIIFLFIVLFVLLTAFSCNRKGDEEERNGLFKGRTEQRRKYGFGKKKDTSAGGHMAEGIGSIGIVDELNPETFVRITILYRRETRVWLEQSQALALDEQEPYIEEKNAEFFTRFGLTEEEYVSYSQNNIEELDAYMEEHPELVAELIEE